MKLSRRNLLKSTALLGGSFYLGFNLTGCSSDTDYPGRKTGALQPNAYLQVTPANEIILQIFRAELGQGVTTGLTTLAGEELGIDPALISLEFAQFHPDFVDPEMMGMITGGSTTISHNHTTVRQAAADLRDIFREAAAMRWGLERERCRFEGFSIRGETARQKLSLSDLIVEASAITLKGPAPLKPARDFQYIGRHSERLDAAPKIDGSAVFSLDIQVPDALVAVVVRCPAIGGKCINIDPGKSRDMPGVQDIFPIGSGIAVVAESYWQARKAAAVLDLKWDHGAMRGIDSEQILIQQKALLETGEAESLRDDGEFVGTTAKTLTAEYQVPHLAHAAMEPINATVHVTDEGCEVWAGNQAPDTVQMYAAGVLGISPSKVKVHSTWVGGGFGRKASMDFITDATEIAQKSSRPVKMIWSREDDIRNDYYRPASVAQLTADIDINNQLQRWTHKLVSPSIIGQNIAEMVKVAAPEWTPEFISDWAAKLSAMWDYTSHEGASDIPYQFPAIKVDMVTWDPGIRLGYWRSVGHSINGFIVESFIDEVAHTLGEDPLEFRLTRLNSHPRQHKTLALAAEKAGWGNPEPGRFQGLALQQTHGTPVAQIAEVSVENNQIKVHKVTVAVDCGMAVNPDIVKAQMEGGVIFGLTAALKGEITFKDGAAQQSNFHDYPLLRMDECPVIETHIVQNEEPPGGVGETAVAPIAPAVANAVFRATGKRLRQLPLRLG